jgi:putative salt-induced outer membrane protein YdiY
VKRILATIIVAAGVTAAFAQTSTSSAAAAAPPKPKWESSASLGVTLTRGNSDTTLFTVKGLTDRKDNVNEFSLGADAAYGANNGVENAESLHGFGQWDHLFSDKFFGYVRVEGLHDGIADIRYRALVGPGAGYYLLKGTNTTLAAEAGGSMVFERLGAKDSSYATIRLAEHFEHKFAAHGVRVWQKAEILPQVDDFKNYIVNAEVGVETSIAKNLSLQTYLDDSYANQPAPGRQKNDVKLVSAISYKF